MSIVDPQKFYSELDRKVFKPVYLLFGEESFFIDEGFDRIKKSVLGAEEVDFNFSQFYAREHDVQKFIDEALTLPVFAQKRVVAIKDVHELQEKEWSTLLAFFQNMNKFSDDSNNHSFVMILMAPKLDKRKKSVKAVLDLVNCIEFRKPFEYQIPQWIKYLCQNHDVKMSEDARQLLHRLLGSHLVELQKEIIKLKAFIGERKNIEVEDVRQIVSSSREESIFEFTKAMGRLDRVWALESLVRILDQGQNEIGVVSLLARHVRILIHIKSGQETGLYGAKLAEKAQVPSYFLEEYIEQAHLWNLKKLYRVLDILADTDRALKSSPVSSHIWLENLVLQTCSAC